MVLRSGYLAVALKLQEAADLSSNDVRSRLSDAIQDAHRGTAKWGYYIDHFGDAESGDVIYACDGDTMRAPYEISGADGAAKCVVNMDDAQDVVPRTVYEVEQDEADHYAAMEESLKAEKLYDSLPIYERFIPKSERKKAVADDFAGKGRSFPILKPEDVMAAVHAMGRAGSDNMGPSGIKARIIAIAKRKGWEKQLPKAWQGDSAAKESANARSSGALKLVESAPFKMDLTIREALTPGRAIKLISPGKGSSAWYTPEALKKAAADKIFKAGTPMRIDHPTAAEEAARPEGSVRDWGAVLAKDAFWLDNHTEGPGLYSEVKTFSDHAQTIEEKGPYAGVSICANGNAVMESGRTVMRDGVPVLKEFTSAQGVDMVTRAGAGGLFLTEAARSATTQQEDSMEAAEVQKLIESAVQAANAPLIARAIRGGAIQEAGRILKDMALPPSLQQLVVDTVLREGALIPTTLGQLDTAKLKEAIDAEAKRVGAAFSEATGAGRVFGMGSAPQQIDAKEVERRATAEKAEAENAINVFESLMGDKRAAEFAAKGRAA